MTDDTEHENDLDFTAWEAPPMMNPQLADDVIAQLKRSVPTTSRRNRRLALAAGALVACGAAALVGTVVLDHQNNAVAPLPEGMVNALAARVYRDFPGASYAQRVELGDSAPGTSSTSSVDLEVNAGFRAAREGREIYVVDARGEANWQIGGQDRLHIQLGKTPGLGIMIDASNGGRVITRIRTNADEPIHVEVAGGDGVLVHAYRYGQEVLVQSARQSLVMDPPGDWRLLDDKTVAIDPFASCDDHRRSADGHARRNELVSQIAELEAAYACDGRTSDAAAIASAACANHDEAKARRYFPLASGVDTKEVVDACLLSGIALQADCTPDAIDTLKVQGTQALSEGHDAAALVHFEQAYACNADTTLIPRMVLASCKSENAAKAKLYYAKCDGACTTLVARCQTYNVKVP